MTEVLVAGATGMLGSSIVDHLLIGGRSDVRMLVRNPDAKRQLLDGFVGRGAQIRVGSVADEASLAAATDGVETVISALQGGAKTIVDGQVALAQAAKAAGATRFFPSDFALDLWAAPLGTPTLALRRAADERIDQIGLDVFHVLNGGFMDMMVSHGQAMINLDEPRAVFWGSGDDAFDMTTVSDTARFTARLAADRSAPAGTYRISGGAVSFNALADAIAERTGQRVPRQSLGTLEQLADQLAAAGDPWSHVMEWYTLALMATPAFTTTDNDRYDDARPETVAAFLDRSLSCH